MVKKNRHLKLLTMTGKGTLVTKSPKQMLESRKAMKMLRYIDNSVALIREELEMETEWQQKAMRRKKEAQEKEEKLRLHPYVCIDLTVEDEDTADAKEKKPLHCL